MTNPANTPATPVAASGPPSVTDAQGLANTALQTYKPYKASDNPTYLGAAQNDALYKTVAQLDNTKGLPPSEKQTYTPIQDSMHDYLNDSSNSAFQANQHNTATQQTATPGQATASQATAGQATSSTNPGAATYNAAVIGSMTPQAIAAQGQVDPRSLMQNQYSELMNFPPDQIPDWAKGAVTAANQALASHGLGSSSVAGQAITAALMQAALPIASNDSKVFEDMNLANLNNRQQTAIVNTQARVQTMMSDQAAINASKQFNSTSTNQTNQFYSSLATQVSQFNAAQLTAISQSNASLNTQTSQFNATQKTATSEFNASQGNAISQFNAQLQQQQQQFNANNALIVAQSNVQWQRQINTANTAGVNLANNTNATNLLNMSNQDMANLWQSMRDSANFAFTADQNTQNRAAMLAGIQLNSQAALKYLQTGYSLQQQQALGQAIGGFAGNLLGKGLDAIGTNIGGFNGTQVGDGSGTDVGGGEVGSGEEFV